MASSLDHFAPVGPPEDASLGPGVGAPYTRAVIQMDTLVTIHLPSLAAPEHAAIVDRALSWFRRVEAVCSRFDPHSELSQLRASIRQPTPVSDLLYEALAFALAVARASGGAFDPTLGHRLEARGFNRHYQTGAVNASAVPPDARPSWRDVELDPTHRTVSLRQPLVLDLGAVAKGLAIDLAARELRGCRDFMIEAGGDVYVGGRPAAGTDWHIGVRHPRQLDALAATLHGSDIAICTSGDYERRGRADDGGHHLIAPRTDDTPTQLASVTVVAPTTMAADALATAAFILGPRRGRRFLERQGVEGLLITTTLEQFATSGWGRHNP